MFSGTKTYEPDKKKGKIEKRLTGEIEEIEARIGGRIKKNGGFNVNVQIDNDERFRLVYF